MRYLLDESARYTFSALSQLADDERGPQTGTGRGSTPPTPPPPPPAPPKKTFRFKGGAVKKTVGAETPGSPQTSKEDQPPPRCGKFTGVIPPGCELNPDWCNISGSPFNCKPGEEKNSSNLLLYGAGALVLYLLFIK